MTLEAADAVSAPESLAGNPKVPYAMGLIVPDEAQAAQIRTTWEPTPPTRGEPLKWRGPCVVCTHEHTVEVPYQVVEGAVLQDVPVPVSVQVRQFTCMCAEPHEGRPEGVAGGCGRYWLGRIEHFEQQADGAPVETFELSVESNLSLLPRARALDQEFRTEGVRASKLAEKWVAGVTALLGLLSVSSIATGADAAKQVREDLRWLVFAAAVLALVSAALALVFAYRAAFGSLNITSLRDQQEEQIWLERKRSAASRTVSRLRTSFVLTLVSMLFAIAVAGLLWFLPREKAPAQCTVKGHGSCQVT